MSEDRTSINITEGQKKRLFRLGGYGEKMSDIIERLLIHYEQDVVKKTSS